MRAANPFFLMLFFTLFGAVANVRSTHSAESESASWRLTKPEVPEGPRNEALLSLDESWADYDQAVAKASDKLLRQFDAAVASATKKGDLGAVQALADAQKAFENQGVLPTDKSFLSAVAGLKKQVATANTALMRSYTKAITTLTKNGTVEDAKRLQTELDSVFAGVAVAGGPRKAMPKQWMVDLSDEATLKKEWAVQGKYDLQVIQQGQSGIGEIKLWSGASMTTASKFDGDFAAQIVFGKGPLGDHTIFQVAAYGHELEFRDNGKFRLEIRREGNQLKYALDGRPPTVLQIKEEHLQTPTALSLKCVGLGQKAPVMYCTVGQMIITGRGGDVKVSGDQQ